jgi:hypothetical protein
MMTFPQAVIPDSVHRLLRLSLIGLFMVFLTLSVPVNADIQYAHEHLSKSFREAEEGYATHLQALWLAHLDNSPTIVLALNKLEEKTGKKVKNKDKNSWRAGFLRNMLQAGAYGASALTGSVSPLIGAGAIGTATAPDRMQAHLETVTSSDMVQLVKQIEDEQSSLLMAYLRLRQAMVFQNTTKSQLDALQHMGATLPQTDGAQLSQFFSLHELASRRYVQAQDKAKDARTALMMMSNRDVVLEIERQVQAELTTQATQ